LPNISGSAVACSAALFAYAANVVNESPTQRGAFLLAANKLNI
jgi:hypothetical protein